jgi:hypothetical protein
MLMRAEHWRRTVRYMVDYSCPDCSGLIHKIDVRYPNGAWQPQIFIVCQNVACNKETMVTCSDVISGICELYLDIGAL